MKTTLENLIGWLGFIVLLFVIAFLVASVLDGYLSMREDRQFHDNSLVLMQKMKEKHK